MIILVNHVLFDFGKVYILVNSILAAIQEKNYQDIPLQREL